jgi:hypothetical protein
MNAAATRFELRTSAFASVDAAAGVIRGVAVISQGSAKGHGLQIDATTLAQVKACAETYANGLKVKMSHAGDAGDIVGYLSAFRIEGDKLLADLTLLKTSRFRDYVLELAATIPDTFGLSISFSGPVETRDAVRLARCSEIYSADLVSEPAANPTGLFEAKPAPTQGDKPGANTTASIQKTTMSDDTQKDPMAALAAAVEALSARLSKLEAGPAPKPEEKPAEMSAIKPEDIAQLAAEAAFKKFAATFGTPPAAPSAEGKAPAKPDAKTFEELVISHPKYSENKAFAISDTVAKHGDAHRAYLGRLNAKQDVKMF